MRFFFLCVLALLYSNAGYADLVTQNYTTEMGAVLRAEIDKKADNDTVVHLAGDEIIAGTKNFTGNVKMNNLNANTDGAVTLTTAVADASNDNQVATTAWANARVTAAKGDIPVGGKDSTTFTKIWLEE